MSRQLSPADLDTAKERGRALIDQALPGISFQRVSLGTQTKPAFHIHVKTGQTVRSFRWTPRMIQDFRAKGRLCKTAIVQAAHEIFEIWSLSFKAMEGLSADTLTSDRVLTKDLESYAASLPGFVELCQEAARQAVPMLDKVEPSRLQAWVDQVQSAVRAALRNGVQVADLHIAIDECAVEEVMDA